MMQVNLGQLYQEKGQLITQGELITSRLDVPNEQIKQIIQQQQQQKQQAPSPDIVPSVDTADKEPPKKVPPFHTPPKGKTANEDKV